MGYLLDKNIFLIEIGIIQSALSVSMFIFEFPTGYVSDKYGRKKSIFIGNIIIMLYLIIFLFSNHFSDFIIGSVCYGIGMTFISGSNEALVYDNLKGLKKEKIYNAVLSKINFFSILGLLVSIFVGGILSNYLLKSIFIVGIIIRLLTALIIISIKEFPYIVEEEQISDKIDLKSYKKLIFYLVAAACFTSFFSIYALFGQQILVVNGYDDLSTISNLFVLMYFFGAIVSLVYKKLSDRFAYDKLLFFNGIFIFLLLLTTLNANINKYYFLIFIVVGALYEINDMTYTIIINKMARSNIRARIFSLYSLITTVFMSIFSILITTILTKQVNFNYNFFLISSTILVIATIITTIITKNICEVKNDEIQELYFDN